MKNELRYWKITSANTEILAFDLFGIKGNATVLPGELDFNFRIKDGVSDGYILKNFTS
jgi:hypothetical protein